MDIALNDLFQHDISAVKALLGWDLNHAWQTGRNLNRRKIRFGSAVLFGVVVGDVKLPEMTVSGVIAICCFHFKDRTDI